MYGGGEGKRGNLRTIARGNKRESRRDRPKKNSRHSSGNPGHKGQGKVAEAKKNGGWFIHGIVEQRG